MTDYTAAAGDTFASIAKQFFGDEAAAKPLAKYNKAGDETQPPATGASLSIPPRLYGEKSRDASGGTTTVALSMFTRKTAGVMIFFSPALQKYCVLETAAGNAFSTLSDEANAAKELARKILDGWQGGDFATMLTAMRNLAREAETFFEGLASAPKDAVDELIAVTKHPDWDETLGRLFVRPKRITGAGTWKDAADSSVRQIIDSLRDGGEGKGLATGALSALCPGAQDTASWPWQWKFSDAQAAASGAAQAFSSSVTARFVRFLAGCGLTDKLDELEKKIPLGESGNLAFALDTGKLSGAWHLPSENGVNLFDLFGVGKSSRENDPSCLLRLSIEAKGYACAESQLSHFVSLPGLSFGQGGVSLPAMGAAAGGSARAEGKLSGAIAWSKGQGKDFANLATVDLTAPLGTSQQLSVGFSDKTLRCNVPIKNIKGLSGDGSLAFDVNSEEGMRLVEYVFACVIRTYCSGLTGSQEGFSSLVSSKFKNVIDFVEKKTHDIASTAQSFLSWFHDGSVVDGTAHATWDVPDAQGFDLVSTIKSVPLLSRFVKPGAHCFLRMRVELSGYAFGSKTGGASSLPGGIGSLGAAAGGSAGLSAFVEWRASEGGDFRRLGSVQSGGALSAMAGAAMAVPFAVEHKNGNLNGIVSLKAIPGIGRSVSGNVAFSASGAEADAFVNNLFSSLDADLSSFLPAGAADVANLAKSVAPNLEKDVKNAARKLFGSL
jgi:hypothetical protein